MEKKDRYSIRVLERALCVLNILSEGNSLKLSELSERSKISSSTLFRILKTLSDNQYVIHDQIKGGYRLGIRCLELASVYYENDDIRSVALHDLEWLRDESGETVHLGILENMEVVYLEKLPGLHAIGLMSSRVGRRSPTYCTGLGKALIAFEDLDFVRNYFSNTGLKIFTENTIREVDDLIIQLEKIRITRIAWDNCEHEVDVRCVASPIFDSQGQVVAAISVSGPANRLKEKENNKILVGNILEVAQNISKKIRAKY